jgi:hypothetical protein
VPAVVSEMGCSRRPPSAVSTPLPGHDSRRNRRNPFFCVSRTPPHLAFLWTHRRSRRLRNGNYLKNLFKTRLAPRLVPAANPLSVRSLPTILEKPSSRAMKIAFTFHARVPPALFPCSDRITKSLNLDDSRRSRPRRSADEPRSPLAFLLIIKRHTAFAAGPHFFSAWSAYC